MLKRTTIIEAITLINIIIFLYTGISKLMDYSVFVEQLNESPILHAIAQPVAILLPWFEFLLVIMLIVPRWRIKGLFTSLGLMIIFTTYIVSLFSINKEMPCSCGGLIGLLSWQQHIIFNCFFILLNLLAIRLLKKEKTNFNDNLKEQQRVSNNTQLT